jgi:hypothetical protein
MAVPPGLLGDAGGVRIGLDAAGNGILVTASATPGQTTAPIWVSRYASEGDWSPLEAIGTAVDRAFVQLFDLATDDSGRAIAVWEAAAPPTLGGTRVVVHVFGRPVARFTYTPQDTLVGQTTRFDASSSRDDDGRIVAYDWDFDGDGLFDRTGVAPEVSFATAGPRAVRLRVTDDRGDVTEVSRTFTVRASAVTPPDRTFTLRISVSRAGGFVGSTDGTFSCGTAGPATCSVQYAAGAVVNVYASNLMGANVLFESWGGDCAGGPNLTLTMSRDYTCSVVFASGP